jgi:hypothetical protein
MAEAGNLTGRWVGYYYQHGRPHPIAAEFSQDGARLRGSMRDGETEGNYSVFEAAAEAGLPPGADEQIIAGLRNLVPEAQGAPIRSVSRLPRDSVLEGHVQGRTVSFRKSYQGVAFSGYQVGDRFIGVENAGHIVHYRGQLNPDATEIDGSWWIDPERGVRRTEGHFTLRREWPVAKLSEAKPGGTADGGR